MKLLPIFVSLGMLMGLAHADLLLEELPNNYHLDGFGDDVLVSVDACTESTFVAITGNGKIFLSKSPAYWRKSNSDWPPPDILIAGDSSSIFGKPMYGRKVICENDNSLLISDTWTVYRIGIAEKKVETVLSTGNIMKNLIQDDSGHYYIVTSGDLYKVGSDKGMAQLHGDVKDFAIQDDSHFLGLGEHSLYYFENGKVDTLGNITDPRYSLGSCMRIPGGYLIIDTRDQAYFMDPTTKAVKKWISPPDLNSSTGNGYSIQKSPFGDTLLISSGGFIFSLANGDSNIVKEEFRNQRDSSLMSGTTYDPGFIFSISLKKSDGNIYLAAERMVFLIRGSIQIIPVGLRNPRLQARLRPHFSRKTSLPVLINGRRFGEIFKAGKSPPTQ